VVGTYNGWLVLCSIVVAIFVAHTALGLSCRVARAKAEDSMQWWLIGGSLAMGTGIWAMHFLGMLAFSLPIPLTYDFTITAASLLIAVVISAFALAVAADPKISTAQLSVAALIMGAGISGMHYAGMSAIEIQPMITYEPRLVIASIIIAVAASYAALWVFFQLRGVGILVMRRARVGAAFIMGLAISGMHYTAMAASHFHAGSICTGGANISKRSFAVIIVVVSVSVLAFARGVLIHERRSEYLRRSASLRRTAQALTVHRSRH